MKSTGIVRRIDDLGRVVIPKEIRRTLGIREGEPLEIFVDDNIVALKKYNPTVDKTEEANKWLKKHSDFFQSHFTRFSIEGNVTNCEGFFMNRRVTGSAVRNPSDDFVPAIGMVYAASRAFNISLPEGWN